MKRYAALLMGAILLISGILTGCGAQPVEDLTAPEEEILPESSGQAPEEHTLSVYVVNPDGLYADALSSFSAQGNALDVRTFRSYQAMADALLPEEGPDVVLYHSMQGELDAQALAQSGMFLPLDSWAGQLDPAVYPAALMDGGKIAGKQYFIPFSYNLIYAYTSQQRMTEMGYNPTDSLYGMILAQAEALVDVPDRIPTSRMIYRPDPVNSFFDAAGIRFFDKATGEVTVDKADFEKICRFVKVFYDTAEKNSALSQRFARDFAGAVQSDSFFTEDVSFLNNVRYYQSMFAVSADRTMVALPYHKQSDPQELCASIVCYGGVTAGTKMPEKAYALLQYILDYDVSANWSDNEEASAYYAPVSLAAFRKAVEKLSATTGYGPVTIAPLTEENGAQLLETAQKITDAVIPNAVLGLRVQAILEPYFMGQDSFDNCYHELLEELQRYLNE